MNRVRLSGIVSLIPFLQILDKNRIGYELNRERDDSVMVTITVLKRRIEIDFFQDHIEYSWFDGDESVHDDQGWLCNVLESWIRD